MNPLLERARSRQANQRALGVQTSPLQQMRAQQQAAQQPQPSRTQQSIADMAAQFSEAMQSSPSAGGATRNGGGGGGASPWGRGLGMLVNNPVTRTAIKPLEVLDYGRRAAVLGVEHLTPLDSGDDRSIMERMRDPMTGFGQITPDTGIKWLDRGIGFMGDVALDPLTYFTLGAGRFIGGTARLQASARMAHADHSAERVARMARLGVNAASPAEREFLGAGQAGLRWAGQRIPGTTTFAEATGEMLARGRARVADTLIADRVGRLARTNREVEAAALRLLRGTSQNPIADAHAVGVASTKRFGKGSYRAKFGTEVTRFTQRMSKDERLSSSTIESGVSTPWADEARQLLYDIRQEAVREGLPIGDLGPNYLPHIWTKEGRDWLQGNDPLAQEVRRLFSVDTFQGSNTMHSRRIKTGTYNLNGHPVTLRDGTIDEINRVLRDIEPSVPRFLEDDVSVLIKRYSDGIESDIASRRGIEWLLESQADIARHVHREQGPTLPGDGPLGGPGAMTQRIDDTATKQAQRARVADVERDADVTKRAIRERMEGIDGGPLGAQGQVGEASRLISEVDEARDAVRRALTAGMRDDPITDARGQAESALEALERVAQMADSPHHAVEVRRAIRELEDAIQFASMSPELDEAAQLLQTAARQLEDVERLGWTLDAQRALIAKAKNDPIEPIMVDMLQDGWKRIGDNLLRESDAVAVPREVAQAFNFVVQEMQGGALLRLLDNYTAFFKAFATATPGFHVRNFLSAAFMNLSDGVGFRRMSESMQVWREYRQDPRGWMDRMARENPKLAEAMEVTFASGAGGRWSPDARSVDLFSSEGLRRVSDNWWTRRSNQAGEWVEGPIRLATALDTILHRNGTAQDALERITRLHFDYSQVSRFDQQMRRLIPFWTFMSRNLPLQLQQMWLKPRAYAAYNSFVRNVRSDDPDDPMPLWWRERGAFGLGVDSPLSGNPLYAMPDLQHIGLQEDLDKAGNLQRLLADANPLFRVPLETVVADQQFFTGRPFFESENRIHYGLEQMLPTLGQLQRLVLDQSDYAKDRRPQSIANWLGIPLREMTEGQLEAELRRLAALEGG